MLGYGLGWTPQFLVTMCLVGKPTRNCYKPSFKPPVGKGGQPKDLRYGRGVIFRGTLPRGKLLNNDDGTKSC